MNTITVQSTDGRAFWERDERHPGGEVFVSGETAVKVAETRNVKEAIKVGRLKIAEVTKKGKKGITAVEPVEPVEPIENDTD